MEIESALTRGIRVIPVLVDGARMPTAAELPPGDRERHLDTACDGDTSLRRELENLLAFDEETGAGLDRELEDTIRGQAEELARMTE
mgnify:CR=1 FL=1